MHVFYLHGFASSPQSAKAQFLSKRFGERGITLRIPDFNKPDFPSLTISRMLQQLEHELSTLPTDDEEKIVLIGSSLGGLVAVEAAARNPWVGISHVVLLAPALEFEWPKWPEIGEAGVEGWRQNGEIEVFHYGENGKRKLKYSFYEDAHKYKPLSRQLELPLLIFQGRRDESVNPATVEKFAKAQRRTTLHMLDDEHQFKKSLPFIWRETAREIL